MKNPMKLAQEYAKRMKEEQSKGKNVGDLLMYYSEEMSRKTHNNYVDCKVMIRFCWDGFVPSI